MYAVASGVEGPFKWQYVQLLVLRVIVLTLKAIYKLQRLFGGPLSQVWGNWLDNVNVIVGVGVSWIARRVLKKSDKPEGVHQGFLKFEGLGHSEQTMFTVMPKEMGRLYLIHHSVFYFNIFVGALQKMFMEAKRRELREGSMLSVQLTHVKNLQRHTHKKP